jgi:hypothetical protein
MKRVLKGMNCFLCCVGRPTSAPPAVRPSAVHDHVDLPSFGRTAVVPVLITMNHVSLSNILRRINFSQSYVKLHRVILLSLVIELTILKGG